VVLEAGLMPAVLVKNGLAAKNKGSGADDPEFLCKVLKSITKSKFEL
jgi:hypothetical protein